MVSLRCKMVVHEELNNLGIKYAVVDLGMVEILDDTTRHQREILKEKFSVLTDWDLLFSEGKERELVEKVGNRLRKNREEVIDL